MFELVYFYKQNISLYLCLGDYVSGIKIFGRFICSFVCFFVCFGFYNSHAFPL